jgi:hypothetical protein
MVEQDGAWTPLEQLDQEYDDKSAAKTECDRLNQNRHATETSASPLSAKDRE